MPGFGPIGASALAAVGSPLSESLTDAGTATDALVLPSYLKFLADEADASELLTSLLAGGLADVATATVSAAAYGQFLRLLADEAEASESLRAALLMVLADEADATELLVAIQQRFNVLVDRVLATDGLVSALEAVSLVYSAAVASELLAPSFSGYLSDEADATDVLAARMRAIAALLDEADATDLMSNQLSLLAVLSDEGDATDTLLSVATLLGLLESGAEASVVITLDGAQYTAWVLNTENIAVTQYSNYPFNSYAELNDKYYGAANDGLYLLEGDDDAGTAIQAYFRSPLTDFGFASLKRLPEVYIGYTASGDLVFKAVVISPNGVKEEHWYRLDARPAAGVLGTRETTVPVGRGLKSVYWQWELHNIDGADFQLEAVRMWPMGLTRRVR